MAHPTQSSSSLTEEKTTFKVLPPGVHYSLLRWATPFVAETFSGTALIFMPLIVGNIINRFSNGDDGAAWSLVWLIIGLVLLLSANEKIGWGTLIRTQMQLERDWRLHVSSLLPGIGAKGDPGAIIAVMNKDTKAIANMLMPLNQSCSALAIALFGTIQLWLLSPLIAIATLAGVTLTIVVLTQVSKLLEKRAETFRDKIGANTSKASDIATSIRTIVGLGATSTMMKRYTDSAHDVRASQLDYERINSWSSAVRVFLIGATTILATALALRGNLLDGTWVTHIPASQLITVTGIVSMMVGPIWTVENFLRMYRDARVAYRRIDRLAQDAALNTAVHKAEAEQDDAALANLQAQVPAAIDAEVADLATTPEIGHNTGGELPTPALKALTQELGSGRNIHYINPRTYQLTAQDYAEALAAHLRSHPALVGVKAEDILFSEPNPMIFAGTLHDHLSLGAPSSSLDYLEEYLELTDSIEIAHRLGGTNPADYWQATISAEGTNLSGGQRQRLALARAYAQGKPVLVLTEPVNSVDEPSQQFIYDGLQKHAAQSGALAHLKHIFIISTTLEADRRATSQTNAVQNPAAQTTQENTKGEHHA